MYPPQNPPAPQRPRKRNTLLIVLLSIMAVLIVAAVTVTLVVTHRPAATPAAQQQTTSTPATTPAASPTPTYCPNGRLPTGDCAGGTSAVPKLMGDPMAPIVCPKILQAQGTQAIYDDPDAMTAIGAQAANSLDFDIAFAGKMLVDKAKLAKAAKGRSDEMQMSLGMGTAATNLATACVKGGFKA